VHPASGKKQEEKPMRLKFFTIPTMGPDEATEELTRFLANNRVLSLDRQFVDDGPASFWAVCVTTLNAEARQTTPKRPKIDYREVLSATDFAAFAKLRDLRKQLSDREGVPPYALFTNDHLATMVRERIDTAQKLGAIPGVGPARVEKYAEAFLGALKEAFAKRSPQEPADAPS